MRWTCAVSVQCSLSPKSPCVWGSVYLARFVCSPCPDLFIQSTPSLPSSLHSFPLSLKRSGSMATIDTTPASGGLFFLFCFCFLSFYVTLSMSARVFAAHYKKKLCISANATNCSPPSIKVYVLENAPRRLVPRTTKRALSYKGTRSPLLSKKHSSRPILDPIYRD